MLALELYERYLALAPAGDAAVTKWAADLQQPQAGPPALNTQPRGGAAMKPHGLTAARDLWPHCRAEARAQDRADIDRTQIIGNRELPRSLHRALEEAAARRVVRQAGASVLDEALAPVDRDVFRRHCSRQPTQASAHRRSHPYRSEPHPDHTPRDPEK